VLPRVLEPEVMDSAGEAEDYNAMDHSQVNRVFVDDLLAAITPVTIPAGKLWKIFDAGTGTALIPIELLQRGFAAEITASDLATAMLLVAQRNLAAAQLSGSVRLVRSDCKRLNDPDGSYDAVMSNSIVHHIPEPISVFQECWRIVRPGGLLFVRDLARPPDEATLDRLVKTYAGAANQHGKQMFRDSLHAALSPEEASDLAAQVGIPHASVRMTSDRHWTLAAIKS
jgi:ubiquinone/menaquinone biosynthesis C-methylase UbiE